VAIGWVTQPHNTELCFISCFSTTTIVFLTEKADFSKLNILMVIAIAL